MPRDPKRPPEPYVLQTEFDRAVDDAAPHRAGSDVRLVAAVCALDLRLTEGRGPELAAWLAGLAFRRFAEAEDTLLFLDQALRRGAAIRYPAEDDPAAAHSGFWARPTPLGLALASCHPDGRVRERAVRRIAEVLADGQAPAGLVAFLVVRTGDWARPVRDPARAALAVLLDADPARLVPAALPAAEAMARRQRGGFARQQILALLMAEGGAGVIGSLVYSHDRRASRLALPVAVATRWIRFDALAKIAAQDADRRCRTIAAQAAAREAVWTEQLGVLRELAGCPYGDVRAVALTGLLRAGRPEEAVGHLGDRDPLVRATAREAARRTGVDAAAWYRAALADPAPGVVADAGPAVLAGPGPVLADPAPAALADPAPGVVADSGAAVLAGPGPVLADPAPAALADPAPGVVADSGAAVLAGPGPVLADPAPAALADPAPGVVADSGAAVLVGPGPVLADPAPAALADPAPGVVADSGAAVLAGPAPGVLAGFAETGRPADAGLLLPLLAHPRHRIRAAAVRALRQMDAVPVADVLPLLRDESGQVVREAAAALSTRTALLPAGLGESLLAGDPRAAVRRAGLRLLAEPDPVRRLGLLLRAASDPDARLRRKAAEAAAALVREVRPSRRRARQAPPLPFAPAPAQARELADLAAAADLAARHPREHRALLDLLA
jgi:hypothetical protein